MGYAIKTAAETADADYNVARLLETPGGFEKFAAENLPEFIKEQRDYEAFGRQILTVHNISGDQTHMINNEPYVYYAKDLNSHATFYGDDMQVPRYQIEGDGVNVAIITISSDDVSINLKRLLVQKYNYLERVRSLSSQAIVQAEDMKILDLTEKLIMGEGTAKNPDNDSQVVTTADTLLLKNHLVELKKCLSQHDLPLSCFVMNQVRIDDILTWATTEIDQLTQREILESGAKYNIWGGVKLIPSRIVRKDSIYAYSEPKYVGMMPILKDLTVKLTERKNKLEQGLFMFEFLGMYMASQKAVAKLILGWSDGDDKIKFYAEDVMARDVTTPVKGYGSLEGR